MWGWLGREEGGEGVAYDFSVCCYCELGECEEVELWGVCEAVIDCFLCAVLRVSGVVVVERENVL